MQHGTFGPDHPLTLWLQDPQKPDRNMQVTRDFMFQDPSGNIWTVPAGYDGLNGASIPRFLWSLVGSPYTGDYRRAAVVHDYFCQYGDVARRQVDKMFFHACRAGGCSPAEARILYLGVRFGASIRSSAYASVADLREGPRAFRTTVELQAEMQFSQLAMQVSQFDTEDPEALESFVDQLLGQ